MAVVPQGAWHRFRSPEGGTSWSATLPGDHIELDVDDPRTAEPQKVIASGKSFRLVSGSNGTMHFAIVKREADKLNKVPLSYCVVSLG
jgi:hypothetical protein